MKQQHPKAKDLKIIPGRVTVSPPSPQHDCSRLFADNTYIGAICNSDIYSVDLTPTADIMADALNIMNAHGHTPSELVAIIRELRECMTEMMPFILEDYYPSFVSPAYKAVVEKQQAALTKTEDFA